MTRKKGILLLNLGSPDSTDVKDVRKYLKEFLSDERVLDSHPIVRNVVLNCFILPRRPKQSAEAYRQIWTDQGSPLIVTSKELQNELKKDINIPIELAMNYGKPSVNHGLTNLLKQNVEEIYAMPMYPHYAMSSYETVVVKVFDELKKINPSIKIKTLQPFYNEEGYIDALVACSKEYLKKNFDYLLFSFHGIPERHLRKSDPSRAHCTLVKNCCDVCSPVHSTCYKHQCLTTAKLFAEKANLKPEQYGISFQSRLGREPWLTPYTDKVLEELPKKGIKNLLVICPSFVADCLETLEEIRMQGRESFIENGGKTFEQIPCLNTHPKWIEYIKNKIQSWV